MPWHHKIDPKFNRKLVKLVSFYFRIQYLNVPRYLLCKELSMNKINNMILAFSDGSRQFSTSAIYLVSFNPSGPEYSVTLVSTLCRLGQVCAKGGEDSNVNTIPKRECNGLYLATCGANSLANLLKSLNLPINKVYICCDAIAHIIALK